MSKRTTTSDDPAATPERSTDRIMAAAAELAKVRGVAGATIARVCQRSGLPVSSVYWHFEDKDALFAEVIKTDFARWLVNVPSWDLGSASIVEGMRAILGPASRTLAGVPDFLRVGLQVVLDTAENNAKARAAYLLVRGQAQLMVQTWLRAAAGDRAGVQELDDLALLTMAFSDGLLVASQIFDDVDSEAYVDLFARMAEQVLEPVRA